MAVIAVVLYHADVPWIPGGFLGVDVFFVLSGFLITSLLLVEFERTGRLNYKEFYLRRARRLLPALFAVLGVTAVLVATIAYDGAAPFRRDLPGALFYYSNWLSILTDTSYFEFVGRPPMLKHLWSLAVEEQFYLIWPTVALVAFRWRGARAVGWVALGGALASTVAMAIGSVIGQMPSATDPSRLYFGTDTHAMGVLVGAALAVIWRPGRTAPILARQAQALICAAGSLGLVLLLWMFMATGEFSVFLYRGGFLVVALVSAVVVAAASHRGVPFGRWLGMRPMRWVGQRSYGIYLWHWPLFLVTRPGVDLPFEGLAAFVARITLLLVVAECSYRFLEMPIRRGALGRAWARVGQGNLPRPSTAAWAAIAAVVVVTLFTGVRVASAPAAADEASATEQYAALAPAKAPLERDLTRRQEAEGTDPRPKVTAFGDSVLLGASGAMESELNVDLHAKVAEQAGALEGLVQEVADSSQVRDTVVLQVGNNGIVTEEQLRSMLESLSDAQRVVLVNARVLRPWMKPNNAMIAQVGPTFPNVVLADWAAASADHRDYFVNDGVHLTGRGAEAFTRVIMEAAGFSTD